jgi:hypothetical protein
MASQHDTTNNKALAELQNYHSEKKAVQIYYCYILPHIQKLL